MLKTLFNGEMIAEKPFTEKVIHFELKTAGIYAVWQKGRLFQRTPVNSFALKLFHEPSGKPVPTRKSIFCPHISDMENARMEMSRFVAEAGKYRLQIVEGSTVSWLENLISKIFTAKSVDYTQYYLQVRESRPVYYIIAAIPLFILCGVFIMGGFVAGFMAPYILSDMGISFTT